MTKRAVLSSLALLSLVLATGARAQQVDPALPAYKPVSGVSGSLKSIGSDTLNNLMTLWSEGFRAQYPNVQTEIEGKGSSTAPPALVAGTAQFGPMSRPMKAAEIDAFEKKFGYKPASFRSAVDALAVFVHKDNPIQCLSLQQLDAIFSKTRKGGHGEGRRHLGRRGPHRRVGEQAHLPLRPQLRLGHLRLLQGGRALRRRLQGQREGAARLLDGGPGRRLGQVRDRLLGRRLQDRRRALGAALRHDRGHVLRRQRRERLLGRVPDLPLPVRLPEPEARTRPSIRCAASS